MEVQIREEVSADLLAEIAKIKVIGVGGGGSNMVNYLMQTDIDQRIELIVANTDAQALMKSPAPIKIQLGNNITKGLGAGMKPEVGEAAANESYDDIVSLLQGTDLVFVSAGMGGGTGTGAAPIIAKAAKAVGALTVGVVTKPFKYEGGKRAKLAEAGIERLKAECDSIIVILNDKLSSMIDR
ncbi:MAG: cell division protein FtsZ, partial [Helicobacter sp.]|nr:cell division protein FtsZ [Helicobacter sp.]